MAHFTYSAFCDESGESTIGGQMAACKANGISQMELRGFGKNAKRTWYSARKFTRWDFLCMGGSVGLMLLSFALTALNGGRFYNPFL